MSKPQFIKTVSGELVNRMRVNEYDTFGSGICGDCGAEENDYHEMNCDLEKCPICYGQLFSCDCWVAYVEEE